MVKEKDKFLTVVDEDKKREYFKKSFWVLGVMAVVSFALFTWLMFQGQITIAWLTAAVFAMCVGYMVGIDEVRCYIIH